MARWDGYGRFCSLARGLDLIGERWTLVIIQELLHADRRYGELRRLLPGIGSNVLSDRLRTLEEHGLVARTPGAIGEGVAYALTARGRRLGPALALLRDWGLEELLPPSGAAGEPRRYDMSYAVPDDLCLSEHYEWSVDGDRYTLAIAGQELTVERGAAAHPVLVVRTTRAFLRRWVRGEATWDSGRVDGQVTVEGSAAAWERMLVATGYPGRPRDIVERVRAQREVPARSAPSAHPVRE